MTDRTFPFNLPDPELRRFAKALKDENRSLPDTMERLPAERHADQTRRSGGRLVEVWRSKRFLCQVYAPNAQGFERLSICRAEIDTTNRRWRDGISWDELMQVKREVGRGDLDAMEAYPSDTSIVNVANFRHLFVSPEPLPWVWRGGEEVP